MITKKIMVFLLMFAILVVIHYIFGIIKKLRFGGGNDRTWKDNAILGISISYILTIIFTGFGL